MSLERNETYGMKFGNLYDTVNQIYNVKKPISRILYITKIKEIQGKDDKVVRDLTLSGIRDEIKRLLKKYEEPYNIMIVYIGTLYALVAIENSNENLMSYLVNLHEEMKSKNSCHLTVNILAFVEDCPNSVFPIWYKYEGSVYYQESQQYKDKPGWVLYDNYFCNLGKTLKEFIQNETDFTRNEARIKKEENLFTKYIPSMDEINEFTGPDFISLEMFINMYVDMLDIELDEDIVWPYHWPINV